MSFYKRSRDQIFSGDVIHGPNFTLSPADTTVTADGWAWFPSDDAAAQALDPNYLTAINAQQVIQAAQRLITTYQAISQPTAAQTSTYADRLTRMTVALARLLTNAP